MRHVKCYRAIALKLLIISKIVSDKSFSVREGRNTGGPYFLSVEALKLRQGQLHFFKFVLRILHQHKFHPYRISLHQDLYGNDFLKRLNFCKWMRRKMRTDVSFLSHVLFSDEANFANTGNLNRHNMHYWANKNPR